MDHRTLVSLMTPLTFTAIVFAPPLAPVTLDEQALTTAAGIARAETLPEPVEAGGCPPAVPGEPSALGSWELLPYDSAVFIVHGAVLHTGKVLLFAGEVEGYQLPHVSAVWDPITGEQTVQGFGEDDLFCGGHAQMADGRILVNGGSASPGQGIHATNIFDPITESWTKVASMNFGRWYPTTLATPDGRIMTFSGWGEGADVAEAIEIYDPQANQWTVLPASADRFFHIYPGMHWLPNGRILYSGTRWNGSQGWPSPPPSALFDPSTNTWSELGYHIQGDRSEGHAVLLPEREPGALPYRVLVAGGWADQDSAEVIDMSQPVPAWQALPNMNLPRNNANGVILPDGNVLFCTGIQGWKWSGNRIDSLEAEMFDPDTNQFKLLAAMSAPGQYHSISLLLPDGRVLKAGGQDGGPLIYEMEVYSPPYLFRGPRPVIASSPDGIGWGQTFQLGSPDAGSVERVVMIKLGAITHHTNTDQRYLSLAWEQTGEELLEASAPPDGNAAPPGYYMLFLVDDCGVPSVASMVQMVPAPPPPPCPADITDDGVVDVADLIEVILGWGICHGTCPQDITGDSQVDVQDLIEVVLAWGECG